eukprot:19967-Heterococcus_DN1.PRE.1
MACREAARYGHTSTLHWLRERGCQWKLRDVCVAASRNGHTDVLDYVMSKWSSDMILWARAQGCISPTVTTGNVDDDDI